MRAGESTNTRRARFTKRERRLWENIAWTQSCTRQSEAMHTLILRTCREFGATAWEDDNGNVYAVKGTSDLYPAIVCHTDTVHDILPAGRYAVGNDPKDGTWWGYDTATRQNTDGKWEHAYAGIGGDDKCGIYLALNYLRTHTTAKAAFFRDEEIGCAGARLADLSFFDDCSLVLEGDRRGNDDFVDDVGGTDLYGDEFRAAVKPIIKRHGYDFSWGALTDVAELKDNKLPIVAANMSCGYYSPHCDNEYVREGDLLKAQFLMEEIADTLGRQQKWEHTAEPTPYAYTYAYTPYYRMSSDDQDRWIRDDERYLEKAGYEQSAAGTWFLRTDGPLALAAKNPWTRGDPCPTCGHQGDMTWDSEIMGWRCAGLCKGQLPPTLAKLDILKGAACRVNNYRARDKARTESLRKANQAPLALPQKRGEAIGVAIIYQGDDRATHNRPLDGCPHCGAARKMLGWSLLQDDWMCLECLDYAGETDDDDLMRRAKLIVKMVMFEGATALNEEELLEATVAWLREGVDEIDIDRFFEEVAQGRSEERPTRSGRPERCTFCDEDGESLFWDSVEGAWYCLECDHYSVVSARARDLTYAE